MAHTDSEDILIAAASAEDIEPVLAITREAFDGVSVDQTIEQALGPLPGAPWRDVKSDTVRKEFTRAPENCFVAKLGGRVVGYVTTKTTAGGLRGEIPNLAVADDCRGRGIGRKLLTHALDHFRRLGLTQAKIETLATNPIGQRLYPSLGFREIARQIHYVMDL